MAAARQTTNIAKYNNVLSAAMALNIDDREHLYNALRDILFPNRIPTSGLNERLKERRFHKGLSCPHCENEQVYRHGLESRKGDRNITDRAPRERGGKSSKRGISNDQDCILVARDRTGQTHAQLACRGRISLRQAKLVLDGILEEVTVLCSDAHGTWKAFAKDEDINHVVLNASKKRRVSDVYHIQNVNSFHGRFKGVVRSL